MSWMEIKKLKDDVITPDRAHSDDAGMDVYSMEDATIKAGEDYVFPLGWACAIPEGWALIMKEKSGRAVKDKLDVGACVIDSGYRGEVHCHLFNNHPLMFMGGSMSTFGDVHIKKGEKIAQVILVPIWTGTPDIVDELNETERGDGRMGSSGLKHNVNPITDKNLGLHEEYDYE